jgi:hypothetical protein
MGSGSAYVFRQQGATWVQEAKLMASDTGNGGFYDASVSLFGDAAVIGAYAAHATAPASGAAYAYGLSGGVWGNEQKLVVPDPRPFQGESFGFSVRINGSLLLIGAPLDADLGENSGSVYVFERSQNAWESRGEFHASNSSQGMQFGLSVDFDGVYAVVAANSTAYVYGVPHCIPAMDTFGICVFFTLLTIAGTVLSKRGRFTSARQGS